jgi:hypothetical protein
MSSFVTTNPHLAFSAVARDALKVAEEEISKDPTNQDPLRGQSREIGSIPFLRRQRIHLALAARYTIKNGQHSDHEWSKPFEEHSCCNIALSPKECIKRCESNLEQCVATLDNFDGKESEGKPAKATPLDGRYSIYAIVIQRKFLLEEQLYYIGTICVYTPLDKEKPERMSLNIHSLYQLFIDWGINRKTMWLMRSYCVDELRRFAEQLEIDEGHQAASNLNWEPDPETEVHLVDPPRL